MWGQNKVNNVSVVVKGKQQKCGGGGGGGSGDSSGGKIIEMADMGRCV